jgi:hypothetical protein
MEHAEDGFLFMLDLSTPLERPTGTSRVWLNVSFQDAPQVS